MKAPETYKGYDKEGQCVAKCTAVNANEYINPDEVNKAIDNVVSVTEKEIEKICNSLNNIAPDATEAVIVEGTNMRGLIEDACESLKEIPKIVKSSIESMYNESVKAHDEIQTNANDKAYNSVKNKQDVVSVR